MLAGLLATSYSILIHAKLALVRPESTVRMALVIAEARVAGE